MKLTHYIFFISFCAIFQSCSDNTKSQLDSGTDSFIQKDWRIKSILSGVWVPDTYIQLIESTKSPYKSADALNEVATMIIKCDSSITDSIIIGASWNNHEGYNFTLYFDTTNYLLTSIPDYDIESNNYRLGYDIANGDTFLFLAHFSKDKRLIAQKKFRRVAQNQSSDNADWGLTHVVNDRLFRGQYSMLDSTENIEISFSNAGQVQNFHEYKSYSVLTDFIGPTDFDNICFEKNNSKHDCFSFKFSGDTLILYELVATGEEDFEKIGDIKYILVRTKN